MLICQEISDILTNLIVFNFWKLFIFITRHPDLEDHSLVNYLLTLLVSSQIMKLYLLGKESLLSNSSLILLAHTFIQTLTAIQPLRVNTLQPFI